MEVNVYEKRNMILKYLELTTLYHKHLDTVVFRLDHTFTIGITWLHAMIYIWIKVFTLLWSSPHASSSIEYTVNLTRQLTHPTYFQHSQLRMACINKKKTLLRDPNPRLRQKTTHCVHFRHSLTCETKWRNGSLEKCSNVWLWLVVLELFIGYIM